MPIGLGDGPRDIDIDSCFFISALFASAGSGAAYAWNGFRNAFDFSGFGLMLGVRSGIGLEDLLVGRKLSSRTSTKLEGNNPIDRLSLHSLPIHHDPSPALRHSIRSPSTNPRSRLDYFTVSILRVLEFQMQSHTSPPKLYTARTQQGNREGIFPGDVMLRFVANTRCCVPLEVYAPPPRSLTRCSSFKLKGRDMQVRVEAVARMYEQ